MTLEDGSPDGSLRAELAALRATVAAQGRELAALRAAQAARGRRATTRQIRRRAGRTVSALALALLLAVVPLSLRAAHPFTDLTGGVHDANIEAIYTAGVTRGCVPNEQYCPTGLVTREEMASFLARLGGLGVNPPVANALTAQTAAAAGNANTVGGYAPSGLVRAARGSGSVTVAPGAVFTTVASITLQAPVAGIAVVTAGAYGYSVNGGFCPCEGKLRLVHVEGNATAPYVAAIDIASLSGPNEDEDSAAISYAFPVGPGTNTFLLQGGQLVSDSSITYFGQGSALFVPFGSGGGVGIFGVDEPPAASPPPKP